MSTPAVAGFSARGRGTGQSSRQPPDPGAARSRLGRAIMARNIVWKNIVWTVAVGVVAAGIAAVSVARPMTVKTQQTRVERGKYLVTIGGCNDCHTPLKMGPHGPEPDGSRRLSGHPEQMAMPPAPSLPKGPWMWTGAATNTAFAGPWGVSYARNLTPDQ